MNYFIIISIVVLIISCVCLLIQRRRDKDSFEKKLDDIHKEQEKDYELFIARINKLNADLFTEISNQEIKAENKLHTIKSCISEEVNQIHFKNISSIDKINQSLDTLIKMSSQAIEDNIKFKKIIENFTEIGNDSKNLNIIDDLKEQESIINKALNNVEESKNTNKDNYIDAINIQETDNQILDVDQQKALNTMETTNSNCFITGRAGTGKSFLIKIFEKSTKKRILKTAPTGIAALNISGATLHSVFGFNNISNLPLEDINKESLKLKSEKKLVLQNFDTLIIDEISMVRVDILEKINKVLQVVNNSNLPFGGKQVILFGDLFQLPPITNKTEETYLKNKYGGIYFFFSTIYKNSKFIFIELTKNHRQKQDTSYFNILNNIREGIILDEDLTIINNRTNFDKNELRRVVKILPKKEEAEKVNKDELSKIIAKEYTFNTVVVDSKSKDQNVVIEKTFPITEKLKLKVGCLIMFVSNDLNKRWVNGTLGIVSFLSECVIKVKINNIEYEVHKETFTLQEAVLSNNKIFYQPIYAVEQYPIVLAYAITIHKSQGMTYQKIVCDINNCFATGQAYVALSRCASMDGLYLLNKVNTSDFSVDEDVKNFYLKQKNY
ncbi:MAG: DEAD/DEAH box helicase [Clostridia bacterium]|nr:DEAD/DEAH box helicase [Clostridia bacterium]MDD4408588.1 DEAD/DEAH box helicase [Clostridia bacterium]